MAKLYIHSAEKKLLINLDAVARVELKKISKFQVNLSFTYLVTGAETALRDVLQYDSEEDAQNDFDKIIKAIGGDVIETSVRKSSKR